MLNDGCVFLSVASARYVYDMLFYLKMIVVLEGRLVHRCVVGKVFKRVG